MRMIVATSSRLRSYFGEKMVVLTEVSSQLKVSLSIFFSILTLSDIPETSRERRKRRKAEKRAKAAAAAASGEAVPVEDKKLQKEPPTAVSEEEKTEETETEEKH